MVLPHGLGNLSEEDRCETVELNLGVGNAISNCSRVPRCSTCDACKNWSANTGERGNTAKDSLCDELAIVHNSCPAVCKPELPQILAVWSPCAGGWWGELAQPVASEPRLMGSLMEASASLPNRNGLLIWDLERAGENSLRLCWDVFGFGAKQSSTRVHRRLQTQFFASKSAQSE